MNKETTYFHLGDVLSITTGILVSPRLMAGVYDILNFMTGTSLFTHQLPGAADECRPELFKQHPELTNIKAPQKFDKESVEPWLAEQVLLYGDMIAVEPLVEHKNYTNPMGDLVKMMGKKKTKIVTVIVPSDKP